MGASKKESTATKNIDEKSLPSTGEKKRSKDVTETSSHAEIIRRHFQNKADKAAAKVVVEEASKKKEADDQNTLF